MTKILLVQLDREVDAVVKRLWPDCSVEAHFSPVLDLSHGDVGSDVAIRLADKLRVKPDEIAAQICAEWTAPQRSKCEVLNGFINVRFAADNLEVFDEDPYENLQGAALAIVVVPFSKSTSRLAEFRICCAALSQLLIAQQAGMESCLILGSEILKVESSVVPLVRKVIERLKSAPVHALGTLFPKEDILNNCQSGATVGLWIAPHALPRDSFVSFCHAVEQRGQRLHVVGPSAPWLDFRFHAEQLEDFQTWEDDQLLSLMWHLSGSAFAADMDFSIARTAERANISWFWKSTCERAGRLLAASPSIPAEAGSSTEITPLIRRLGLRASYLRAFYLQAALDGRLQIFMEALSDTLITFNRVFNDPGFRIRQTDGRLSTIEIKIIAGAHRSLSDTITLCDFSKGKRYGSHARTPHKAIGTIIGDYE